jgi:hypothetical protein
MPEEICRMLIYPGKAGGHLWIRKPILQAMGITEDVFHKPKELGIEHRGSSRAVPVVIEVQGGEMRIRRVV